MLKNNLLIFQQWEDWYYIAAEDGTIIYAHEKPSVTELLEVVGIKYTKFDMEGQTEAFKDKMWLLDPVKVKKWSQIDEMGLLDHRNLRPRKI